MKIKDFIITFSILLVFYTFSFVMAFRYEEGTFENTQLGNIFLGIFIILKYPFAYLLPSKYLFYGLLLNITLYVMILGIISYMYSYFFKIWKSRK